MFTNYYVAKCSGHMAETPIYRLECACPCMHTKSPDVIGIGSEFLYEECLVQPHQTKVQWFRVPVPVILVGISTVYYNAIEF